MTCKADDVQSAGRASYLTLKFTVAFAVGNSIRDFNAPHGILACSPDANGSLIDSLDPFRFKDITYRPILRHEAVELAAVNQSERCSVTTNMHQQFDPSAARRNG